MTPRRTNTISVREEDDYVGKKNLFSTHKWCFYANVCIHRITSIYILDVTRTDSTHLWFVEFTIPKA